MARPPRYGMPLALVCLFAFATLPARGAEWPVARGPSHEPVPYRHETGPWKQAPVGLLDDGPACVLYAGANYLIEADGTVEAVTHEIVRCNNRKGVELFGEYRSITYDPSYQQVTLNEARVLKADGRTVPLGPDDVLLRDQNTDFQMIWHTKMLVLAFPGERKAERFGVEPLGTLEIGHA